MRKLMLLLVLTCLPALRADSQTVTLSGQGVLQTGGLSYLTGFTTGAVGFSAVLPTSPTPSSVANGDFQLNPLTFRFTQSGQNPLDVTGVFTVYGSYLYGWGLDAPAAGGVYGFINVYYAAIFTGSPSSPTFKTGTYNYSNGYNRLLTFTSFTIEETPSTTVPEPSSYVLMASGLAALSVVARRRRRA